MKYSNVQAQKKKRKYCYLPNGFRTHDQKETAGPAALYRNEYDVEPQVRSFCVRSPTVMTTDCCRLDIFNFFVS